MSDNGPLEVLRPQKRRWPSAALPESHGRQCPVLVIPEQNHDQDRHPLLLQRPDTGEEFGVVIGIVRDVAEEFARWVDLRPTPSVGAHGPVVGTFLDLGEGVVRMGAQDAVQEIAPRPTRSHHE